MQIPFNNLSIIFNNIHKRLHALLNQPFFINESIGSNWWMNLNARYLFHLKIIKLFFSIILFNLLTFCKQSYFYLLKSYINIYIDVYISNKIVFNNLIYFI